MLFSQAIKLKKKKRVEFFGFSEMPEKIMKSLKIRKQPVWQMLSHSLGWVLKYFVSLKVFVLLCILGRILGVPLTTANCGGTAFYFRALRSCDALLCVTQIKSLT